MDRTLAESKLAALLMYNPATGLLREPDDELFRELGIGGEAFDAAKKAWESVRKTKPISLPQGHQIGGEELNKELKQFIDGAKDPSDLLLALYFYYQVVWEKHLHNRQEEKDKQDKLDPLHASYAASSLAGSDSYYFVSFKISSVQDIIANSRKTSDLWASSFLVSLLSWGIMRYFVDRYGPSCVISPFIGVNPLYVYYAHKSIGNSSLRGRFDLEVKKLLGIDPSRDFPESALLAGKGDLLIPSTEPDPEGAVISSYKSAWRDLYRALLLDNKELYTEYEVISREILEAAQDYPPFPLIEVKVQKTSAENPLGKADLQKKYELWVDYGYGIAGAAHNFTSELYSRGSRYEFCTVCGTNVAAVRSKKDEAEKLCPYCAIKRGFRVFDAAKSALEKLGLKVPEAEADGKWPPRWPSTVTLAAADLIKKYSKLSNPSGKQVIEILKEFESAAESANKEVEEAIEAVEKEMHEKASMYFYILRGDTDRAKDLFGKAREEGIVKYIFVSRSFAVAALDALKIITENGGLPVYSGGDDLVALFPGGVSDKEKLPWPLLALSELISRCPDAFGGKEEQINSYGEESMVYYSTQKNHCRSYSLTSAHAKDPLSLTWRISHLSLELKDNFSYVYAENQPSEKKGAENKSIKKNMVSVLKLTGTSSGSLSLADLAAFLPALKDIWSKDNGAVPRLYTMLGDEISNSFLHDAAKEAEKYEGFVSEDLQKASMKILEMLVKRNSIKTGAAEKAWAILSRFEELKISLGEGNNGKVKAVPWEIAKVLLQLG